MQSLENENIDTIQTSKKKETGPVRWLVLALLCVLIYSMIYCLDNPVAIQNQLIDSYKLTQEQYALLYSVYSYIDIFTPFFGGLLIDYIGIYSSTLIWYLSVVFGQSLFVLSTFNTISNYYLMLSGRAFLGVGQQMIHISRKWLLFDYFIGTEYYFACAISLSSSRLASASQSYVSTLLYEKYKSVVPVVSIGWMLVIISLYLLCIFLYLRKKYHIHSRFHTDSGKNNTDKKFYVCELFCGGEIDRRWVLLGFAIIFAYATYLSYSNVSAAFLQNRYHFGFEQSNMLAPIMFWIAVIFTPIFGILCDVYGKSSIFMVASGVSMLLGHIFLSFIGNANRSIAFPIIGEIFLGMGYSLAAGSTWPSFGLITKQKYLASTFGIWACIENGFCATVFVLVGILTHDYTADEREEYYDQFDNVRYLWIILAVGTIFWTVLLWYYDAKMFGNTLWKPSDKFAKNKHTTEVCGGDSVDAQIDEN